MNCLPRLRYLNGGEDAKAKAQPTLAAAFEKPADVPADTQPIDDSAVQCSAPSAEETVPMDSLPEAEEAAPMQVSEDQE